MTNNNECNCNKCHSAGLFLEAIAKIAEERKLSVPETVDALMIFCGAFLKEHTLPGHEMAVFTRVSKFLGKILLTPDQSVDRSAMH